jgi:polyisoprenyl-teichoic acid--peptidoglycan teichoic acid transferase
MHSRAELSGRSFAGLSMRRALFLAGFCCVLVLVGCQAAARPAPQPIAPPAPAAEAAEAGAPAVTTAPLALLTLSLSATPSVTPSPTPRVIPTPPSSIGLLKKTDNILVMGIDQRPNDVAWRTDTIMVLAVDQPNKRVGVVNIPRDLYVDIPGLGKAKINEADYYGESSRYPGGGPALLERVLTQTLDLPAQHYVRVNMEGLVRLVDALGGVTVTLDCPLYERVPLASAPNGLVDWNLPAGQVQLDGETAKKFATYRYVSTDFGRARRQQQLIWALRNRALQVDVIPRIPALWSALHDTFETDLNLLDVAGLSRLGIGLRPENVHGAVFSLDALDYAWSDEGSSILVVKDDAQMQKELAALFDGQPLMSLGKSDGAASGCPPPPTEVPTYTPTPTGTITASVALTATISGELTGTPTMPAQLDGTLEAGATSQPPAPEPILISTPSVAPAPG